MRIRRASRSESQAQFGAVTFTPKLRENCHYPRQLYNEKSEKKKILRKYVRHFPSAFLTCQPNIPHPFESLDLSNPPQDII